MTGRAAAAAAVKQAADALAAATTTARNLGLDVTLEFDTIDLTSQSSGPRVLVQSKCRVQSVIREDL